MQHHSGAVFLWKKFQSFYHYWPRKSISKAGLNRSALFAFSFIAQWNEIIKVSMIMKTSSGCLKFIIHFSTPAGIISIANIYGWAKALHSGAFSHLRLEIAISQMESAANENICGTACWEIFAQIRFWVWQSREKFRENNNWRLESWKILSFLLLFCKHNNKRRMKDGMENGEDCRMNPFTLLHR